MFSWLELYDVVGLLLVVTMGAMGTASFLIVVIVNVVCVWRDWYRFGHGRKLILLVGFANQWLFAELAD